MQRDLLSGAEKGKNMRIATIYRMVNRLTAPGILQVNMPCQVSGRTEEEDKNGCRILLKVQKMVERDQEEWQSPLAKALHRKGSVRYMGIERLIL